LLKLLRRSTAARREPALPSRVSSYSNHITVDEFGMPDDVCEHVQNIILARAKKIPKGECDDIVVDGHMDDEQLKELKTLIDERWRTSHNGVHCESSTISKCAGKEVIFYRFRRPTTP